MPASRQKLINFAIARVTAEEVRQAAEFQAAILADVAGRRGTLHGRIKPLAPHMAVAGPAITVEVRPGITRLFTPRWPSLNGDVLVIDGKAISPARCWGDHGHAGAGQRYRRDRYRWRRSRCGDLKQTTLPGVRCRPEPVRPDQVHSGRVNHAISVGGAAVQAGT